MPRSYKTHKIDIYDVKLYVTQSARGWREISKVLGNSLEPIDIQDGGITALTVFHPTDKSPVRTYIAIYINPKWSPSEYINTIAHEATHAALIVARATNITVSGEKPTDDEPFCYLVGWITEWLYNNTNQPDE